MKCDQCGRESDKLPYTCKRCGNKFCVTHRLPESHDCIGLKVSQAERYLKRIDETDHEVQPWFKDPESPKSENAPSDYEDSWRRNPGDELKRAAQKVEEKRSPDFEPSPDVAPDGSVVSRNKELESDQDASGVESASSGVYGAIISIVLILLFAIGVVYFLF